MPNEPSRPKTTDAATPDQLDAAGYYGAAAALRAGLIVNAHILLDGTLSIVPVPPIVGPVIVGGGNGR